MRTMVNKRFLMGFFLLLTSCSDYEPTTNITELPAFDQVHLNSVFNVFLIQGDSYSIRIEADEEVAPHISFEVKDGILTVENNHKLKWLTPRASKVSLYITAVALSGITVNETCSIQTLNTLSADRFFIVMAPAPKLTEINLDLDCNEFYYWNNHQCGGKVSLKGRTRKLILYAFALITIDAKALAAEFALVENNSKGNCEIFVNQQLEYSIRGEGDIILYGNPAEILLEEDISSGQLIQTN